MTADRLTLYFGRRSGTKFSIFRSTRDTTRDAFGEPEEVDEIRGAALAPGDLRSPSISPDGDRLLFSYSPTGNQPFRLYESDRRGGAFEPGTLEVDSGATDPLDSDEDPAFHAGGESFLFTSDRDQEDTGLDIYIACE